MTISWRQKAQGQAYMKTRTLAQGTVELSDIRYQTSAHQGSERGYEKTHSWMLDVGCWMLSAQAKTQVLHFIVISLYIMRKH